MVPRVKLAYDKVCPFSIALFIVLSKIHAQTRERKHEKETRGKEGQVRKKANEFRKYTTSSIPNDVI